MRGQFPGLGGINVHAWTVGLPGITKKLANWEEIEALGLGPTSLSNPSPGAILPCFPRRNRRDSGLN